MSISLKISFSEKEDLEYFLNILYLGGISCILDNNNKIDDIEYMMFRHGIWQYFKEKGISEFQLGIMRQGMEIEDISDIAPHYLPIKLSKLKKGLINNINTKSGTKEISWDINDE